MNEVKISYTQAQKDLLEEKYPGYKVDIAIPEEPVELDDKSLDEILLWAYQIGASDINFLTGSPVTVEIEGKFSHITRKNINSNDMEMLTNHIYGGASGVSHLRSGEDIDRPYSIRDSQTGISCNFRVNISSCRAPYGAEGIQATIRTIKGSPLTFAQLGIEQEIIDAFYPEQGLVLACGKTGAGKSTILAAGVRHSLECKSNNNKWLLYEAPPEFVYDEIQKAADLIVQHEIPRHIKSFPMAVRNSLRRAPTRILIGECRDYETISASIEASGTGHALYTTVHAGSVSEMIRRVLNLFPQEERTSKLFELIDALRLVVVQKLVTGLDGKRVAIREYLIFDQTVHDRMRFVQTLKEAVQLIDDLVEEKGQSLLRSAMNLYEMGKIGRHVIDSLEDSKRNLVDDFTTIF